MRYNVNDVIRYVHYEVPQALFMMEQYKGLSYEAKMLYGILLNRNNLSTMNADRYADENGDIFFYFNQEELSKLTGKSRPTIIKYIKELVKYKLLEVVRQGVNLPNRMYLLEIEIEESFRTQWMSKNFTSGCKKSLHQEVKEFDTNNNNINNNNINNTSSPEVEKEDIEKVMTAWNSLNLTQLRNIKGNREKSLHARIKEYSIEDVLKAIDSINNSEFLKGHNNNGWKITFDWLLKPNNFVKVLEGNYVDKDKKVDKPTSTYELSPEVLAWYNKLER